MQDRYDIPLCVRGGLCGHRGEEMESTKERLDVFFGDDIKLGGRRLEYNG